jgi:hypothetical protein
MRRLISLVTAILAAASLSLVNDLSQATPVLAAASTGSTLTTNGYWTFGANARVSAFGSTGFGSSAPMSHLNGHIMGGAATSTGNGYWTVGSDGGVFAEGDARFYGSTGSLRLNRPVVGMTGTADSNGYWFVASDGGVFSYGDARFLGSMGGKKLNQPIVGMAATPSGNGYWLVASDGGIFAYGDAAFFGSTGSETLNQPIVGMAATPSGGGYWLVAADGGVFSFGDAAFHGSAGGVKLSQPVVGMAATSSGGGYYLVARDGGVFTYGDSQFKGAANGVDNGGYVAGIATAPRHRTSGTSIFYYPWYASVSHDGSWRHWDQNNTPPDYIASDYWPQAGAYSSADPSVTTQHMNQIKAAGVNTVVISWWGQGGWEDSTLATLLPEAHAAGLRVAAQIEPYGGRTSASVASDYSYLEGKGINEFYIYQANLLDQSGLAAANDAAGANVRVLGESGAAGDMKSGKFEAWAAAAHFTGVYTYAGFGYSAGDFEKVCDYAHAVHLLCSPSVSPGFSGLRSTPIKTVSGRNNGATYDQSWQGAINAGADIISITSFNEWHEGTQIEPAVPHTMPNGDVALDYSGAYGAANNPNAYLDRTAMWTNAYYSRFPSVI